MSVIRPWIVDAIDIVAVAFVVYRVLVLTKGTRAAQMLLGLLVIVVASLVAEVAHLNGLNWLFSHLRTVWVIAFVILFQPELRRALAQMGQNPVVRFFIRLGAGSAAMNEVIQAVQEMSRLRQGALVVLAKDASLRTFEDTGKRLDARVSAELLQTIFSPRSPLHDGAVIVHEDQVTAAACLLPVSDNPDLPPRFGLRHRAALGLTEETDAVVLVVSEETGSISVACDGVLHPVPDADELLKVLGDLPRGERPATPAPAAAPGGGGAR